MAIRRILMLAALGVVALGVVALFVGVPFSVEYVHEEDPDEAEHWCERVASLFPPGSEGPQSFADLAVAAQDGAAPEPEAAPSEDDAWHVDLSRVAQLRDHPPEIQFPGAVWRVGMLQERAEDASVLFEDLMIAAERLDAYRERHCA